MPLSPPLCLPVAYSNIGSYATNQWSVTLTVTPHIHDGNQSYNGNNIAIGQWTSNASNGFAWSIVNITSQTANQVTCILEDTLAFNAGLDNTGQGGGPSAGSGYLWELNSIGLPVLTYIPNAPTVSWPDSILGRFLFQQQPTNPDYSTIYISSLNSNNINIINSQPPIIVAVGAGSTSESTIMLSTDSLNWTNANTGFDGLSGNGVAYNGSYWVAVGTGTSSASTIMKSTDASNWISATSGFEGLKGNSIAWNGSFWIATGNGVTSSKSSIMYSTDAMTWRAANGGGFVSGASYIGNSVGWNGAFWVATGLSAVALGSIQNSTDGSNWSNSLIGGFTANSGGYGVAWSGKQWTAVGISSRGIQKSTDSKNWVEAITGGFPGQIGGKGITWNSPYFVAVGNSDGNNLSSINISTDGSNWLPSLSGGFSVGYGIVKSNSYWIATGAGTSLSTTILVSTDVNNWSFTSSGFALNGYSLATTRDKISTIINSDGIITNSVFISKTTGLNKTSFARLLELNQDGAFKPLTSTWNTVSDQRVKENVEDANLDICYSDIQKARLRRFNFIDSFANVVEIHDKKRLGFIAQEIQTVIPKIVNQTNYFGLDDFHTINLDQFKFAHYGATKKLIQIVEQQQSTIEFLQANIQRLEAKYNSLNQ